MEHLITWKRGDSIKLGKAIAIYNKEIEKINLDGINYELPELINFKEVKENIKTRKELNNLIKKYKRINQENLRKTKKIGDKIITEYEFKEIKLEKKKALTRLTREKNKILKKDDLGIALASKRIDELNSSINSIKNLNKKTSENLERTIERIKKLSSNQYEIEKALTYRENFEESLKELKNLKNYDLLKNKLDNIKNPIKFYEFVSKSDILSDLFLYYKDVNSLTYGGFNTIEEAFNFALREELNII